MPVTPYKFEIVDADRIRLFYTCPSCGKPSTVVVNKHKYETWFAGQGPLIQNAFPELSDAEREVMMTGFHDECFNAIFADDDDEDMQWPTHQDPYDVDYGERPDQDQMGLS